MAESVKWTAIVFTCNNKLMTPCIQQELEFRQAKGYIDKDIILLTVEDPKDNVGSGGATINALLTVVEYISANKGYTVINADVLKDVSILILHVGRSNAYETCCASFITLPVENVIPEYDGLLCCFDFLIKMITERLAIKSGPGVWVSSTDYLLSIPEETVIPWKECEIGAFSVPATLKFCKDHGVFNLDNDGIVKDILYMKGADELGPCQRRDGNVPLVCGLIYFNKTIAEKFLSFCIKPPLDACCYMGVDSGQPPIKLSLFFDILLPMSTKVTEHDFISGNKSDTYGKPSVSGGESHAGMRQARTLLWKELHGHKIQCFVLETGSYYYWSNLATEYKKLVQDSPFKIFNFKDVVWKNIVHSHVESSCVISEDSIIMNSQIKGNVTVGKKALISHSNLDGNISVGRDAMIMCVRIENFKRWEKVVVAEDIVLKGFHVKFKSLPLQQHVLTIHGRFDNIKTPNWKSTCTFCNEPWLIFLNRTGILREDLWGSEVDNDDQTFLTAKLFPVFNAEDSVGMKEMLWMQGTIDDDDKKTILTKWRSSWRLSFKELMKFTDSESEFTYRRDMFYDVSASQIEQALVNQENVGFHKVYNSSCKEGYTQCLLEMLDKVASQNSGPGVAARTLANIADILGSMADNKGGLRSGPAANVSWKKAFQLLEEDKFVEGIMALAKERCKWLNRPDLLLRAARHYEGAAQILIRKAVMTAHKFINYEDTKIPEIGQWVRADCPARVDLAGGWSDTPPITYEHGGAVTTAALLINGKRPIGARVRRIEEPVIKLEIVGANGDRNLVVCSEISDLEDYYQPHAPGALLKASFICAELVDLKSSTTLNEQLKNRYGGGFEMQSWSNLPQGSGLGTSSILAGAVMGALLHASGKLCSPNSLIHAVLYLEQLLTTGGGWQDQVGGLMGGFQYGSSAAKLPLEVKTERIEIRPVVLDSFNKRMWLIYTGKTRLARNLLQEVIRNWYARNPNIVQTEDSLVDLAGDCKDALVQGDLERLGKILFDYWELKKRMAPGSETERLTEIINILRPYASGISLAGAGGGGFMFVLLKEQKKKEFLEKLLDKKELEDVEVYEAEVDNEGLTVFKEEN